MVTELMLTAAVPFCTARLQTSVCRNIVTQIVRAEKCGEKEKDVDKLKRSRRKMVALTAREKLHLRREKNKTAAQISREKARIQENLLEERLSNLKYEKMKVLLENEALKRLSIELQEENTNLKNKAQCLDSKSSGEEYLSETAIKHAEGMGSFQDTLHSVNVSVGQFQNEQCSSQLSDATFHNISKSGHQHQISTPSGLLSMDSSCTLPTQPHNKEWMMTNKLSFQENELSLYQSNLLLPGSNKSVEESDKNISADLNLAEDPDFLDDIHEYFGNLLKESEVSSMCDSKVISFIPETSVCTNTNNGVDHHFPELPTEWSFDNLYEEMY